MEEENYTTLTSKNGDFGTADLIVGWAVKPRLLFIESQCSYILLDENSPLFFVFPRLLFLTPNHSIFIYQLSKPLSSHFRKKQNKTKTHIETPQNPLIRLSAKFGMYFHVNLGLCTACCTIIFI